LNSAIAASTNTKADLASHPVAVPLRDAAIRRARFHEAVVIRLVPDVLASAVAGDVLQHLGMSRRELIDLPEHRNRLNRLEADRW
jgi:hypothetical protein